MSYVFACCCTKMDDKSIVQRHQFILWFYVVSTSRVLLRNQNVVFLPFLFCNPLELEIL